MKNKLYLILSLSCMLMLSGCIGVTVCSDEVLNEDITTDSDYKDISKNNGNNLKSNVRTTNGQFKIAWINY
ncbi:hypothetical protein [Methanococcus voltae]|uniref:Lipoprotein n=2 Tax=Methanococcus voltae TaxID=2188 RepID=A0A8J7RDY5_METVO|nr:hypothetical protein [Methanococcus voltae]MBP2172596.1 hypothetical protein [Methanococcus voltae]MBP2201497.1 hypothetical protein [Methanococcus voltae]MCS3922286.1 hypothetical protein [Methanococcus voltae PS]